jgi:regulator of protease activity HflC (stomatin/prohibitin superfamily)
MFLVIIGILVLLASVIALKDNPALSRFRPIGRLVGVIFILLGVITAGIKQVEPGEVGVKILFGSIQKDVLHSGLHFINPLLDVKMIDIKTQNYTMSGVNDEGNKIGDDAIKVLTSDGPLT